MTELERLLSQDDACLVSVASVKRALENEPQKMGRWIEGRKEVYKCSACGNHALEWGGKLLASSYCPWCGARMEESED